MEGKWWEKCKQIMQTLLGDNQEFEFHPETNEKSLKDFKQSDIRTKHAL